MPTITIQLSPQDLAALRHDADIVIRFPERQAPPVSQKKERGTPFVHFFRGVIAELETLAHVRTAETYRAALNSLMRFLHGRELPLEAVSARIIDEYEQFLKQRGLAMNTISFYMRITRAVYNRAVEARLVADCRPFAHVYTGMAKTEKRAVTLQSIRTLNNMQLDGPTDFARDMFLFSFFTRGMSFVDMAYLEKTNLREGYLHYCRKKTGQRLKIKWMAAMQQIADKYDTSQSPYLLPIIKRQNGCERSQYRNCLTRVNTALRQISAQMGTNQRLTMYVARHSWASIARELSVPLAVISEGMGHHSEHTTQIYLKALDTSRLDLANERIAEAIAERP